MQNAEINDRFRKALEDSDGNVADSTDEEEIIVEHGEFELERELAQGMEYQTQEFITGWVAQAFKAEEVEESVTHTSAPVLTELVESTVIIALWLLYKLTRKSANSVV